MGSNHSSIRQHFAFSFRIRKQDVIVPVAEKTDKDKNPNNKNVHQDSRAALKTADSTARNPNTTTTRKKPSLRIETSF
jgi:hypothetical protein